MTLYIRDIVSRKEPDWVTVRYQQIQARIGSASVGSLIRDLEKLIASAPQFPAAHNDLGVLYYRSGDKERSVASFEQAVRLEPRSTVYRKNLADLYYVELKRVEDALKLYTEVLRDAPEDVETLVALATVSRDLGAEDDARIFLEKAFAIDPENGQVNKLLLSLGGDAGPADLFKAAQASMQAGDLEQAAALIGRVVEVNPDDAEALHILGSLYLHLGKPEQAVQNCEAAMSHRNDDVQILRTLSACYYACGDTEKAIKIHLDLLAQDPGNVDSLLALAKISIDIEQYRTADYFLGKILEQDSWHVGAWQEMDRLFDRLIRSNMPSVPVGVGRQRPSEPVAAGRKEAGIADHHRPPCSIIIPVYNKVDFTQKCLDALVRHTPEQTYELIIVDNGSSDGTADFLRTLGEKARVIHNRENLGFAKACNQGARVASGDYLLFLNNDTEPLGGWLDPLLAVLRGDAAVAGVGSKLLFPDGTIQHAGVVIFDDRRTPDPLKALHAHYQEPVDTPEANISRTYQALSAACLLVRKETFQACGGFDEGYWNGYEDVDLCFAFQMRGWKLVYEPKSVLIHYESKSGPERFRLASDNIKRLHKKWLGKICPDGVLLEDGDIQATDSGFMQPYTGPGLTASSFRLTSIVILTWNQLDCTKECVESIRRHTPEPYEIIFVDNGSSDGTVEWLRQLARDNANYRVIENKLNLGFAKGCNQGIEVAIGDTILLLNNDVVVTHGWLSGMLEVLSTAGDIGIVGPMTNNISGIQKVPEVGYTSLSDLDAYATAFREMNRHRRMDQRRIVGFCMLFRRELVDRIGLLDERFGSGNFEDDDFCLRASLAGYQNIIAGDVFIHHHGSKSFTGNRLDHGTAMTGNKRLFSEKWDPAALAPEVAVKFVSLTSREKALELNEKGEAGGAVEAILEAMKYSPDDRELYYTLAAMLIENGRHQDALEALESAPVDAHNEERWRFLAGYCHEALGHEEKAAGYAGLALAANPRSAMSLNLKGILAYKKPDREEAQRLFLQACAADPSYGEPWTNMGVMKWSAGECDEAVDYLERGFILSPAVPDIANLYHSAISETGGQSRAEKVVREALGLHPFCRHLTFFLIDCYLVQKKYPQAMEEIEKAIENFGMDDGLLAAAREVRNQVGPLRFPDSKKGAISLCMIVKNEENNLPRCLAGVKGLVDEIIIVDTGSEDHTRAIAEVYGASITDFSWTGNYSEARNVSLAQAKGEWILVLDADEVISPNDHHLFRELVGDRLVAYSFTTRNYVNRVNVEKWSANDGCYSREEAGAGWVPSTKVRFFPNDRNIRFHNPVHELVEPSLKAAGISVKHSPIPIHHYGNLDEEKERAKGEKYYELGRVKLAEGGGDLNALCELAIQAGALGRYDEAVDLWQQVLKVRDDIPLAHFNLSGLFIELQRYDEGLTAARKTLELDAGNREAAYNYAMCQLFGGDLPSMINTLNKLLAQDARHAAARFMLAVGQGCSGARDDAKDAFLDLKKMGVPFADELPGLARKLISAGKAEYARSLLEVAIETGNSNSEIVAMRREANGKNDDKESAVSRH